MSTLFNQLQKGIALHELNLAEFDGRNRHRRRLSQQNGAQPEYLTVAAILRMMGLLSRARSSVSPGPSKQKTPRGSDPLVNKGTLRETDTASHAR